MDVEKLSAELSKRQSRMWQVIDPHAMAEWVFGDPELVEPLDALPAAAPLLDGVRAALGTDLDTASYRSLALGVAGVVIRATVPAAAQTGSAHWLLTEHVRPDWEWIRLTVGVSEVLIAGWSDEEFEVTLRLAASPIEDAFRRRVLDETTLKELGVERVEDNLRSFGDDAVRYRCQDLFAAVEFLCLPVVVTAARLMNARLAAGSFPHTPNYDPAVAAEAWAAAEVVFGDEGPFAALDEDLEFDLDAGYRDEDPIETPAPVGYGAHPARSAAGRPAGRGRDRGQPRLRRAAGGPRVVRRRRPALDRRGANRRVSRPRRPAPDRARTGHRAARASGRPGREGRRRTARAERPRSRPGTTSAPASTCCC